MSINMHALKFMIQSNLCHASRVPAVKNLGALAPPAQWSRRLYLLTYLLSWSKSQSAFFRAEDSRSRRYNSAIEDCSFTASDTVLLGLQHAVQTVHPASSKPATSCPAFSVDPLKWPLMETARFKREHSTSHLCSIHSINGPISYHFQNITSCWPKVCEFSHPLLF